MIRLDSFRIGKFFLFTLLLVSLASCQPKRLGEKIFDLNDFSLGLSVHRLYENVLKKERTEKYSSYSDTIFNYKEGAKKAIAVEYFVDAEKSERFAKFKNVSFFNVKSISDVKDNLMMITAEENCGFGDQMKLIGELKVEYGKPIVKQHIASFTTFTWLLDDRTIQIQCEMIPDSDNYYNKKNDFLNPNGGFLRSDSYEQNHIWKVIVYVFNNDYMEQLREQYGYSESGHKPYLYDYDTKTVSPF